MISKPQPGATFNCTPDPPVLSGERLFVGLLALTMSVAALVFGYQLSQRYPSQRDFHDNIERPVLAIELPTSGDDLRQVLGVDNPREAESECHANLARLGRPYPKGAGSLDTALRDQPAKVVQECKAALAISALRANTHEDFFFIVVYTLFLWRFAALFVIQRDVSQKKLATAVGWVALATASFDCAENVGILQALGADHLTNSMAQTIAWPSRGKWALFGLALLLTSLILLRSASSIYSLATRRLLAIGYAICGALLWAGIWQPRLIELATEAFSLIVLINVVALLGPYLGRMAPERIPEYVSDFCQRKKEGRADVAIRSRRPSN